MSGTVLLSRIVQGNNPREYFDPKELEELEESVRAVGILQPIVVRPCKDSGNYEIIAGERRWRAAKKALGDDYEMPVVIKEVSDAEAEAIAIIENHHRANVSVAEEAHAAQRQLLRNSGDKQETAASLGWSMSMLERRLALLACTPAVLKALTYREIQLGHAELLAGVPPEKQDKVLASLLAQKVPVSVLKAQLGQFSRRLSDAIFDTAQCRECPHNSVRQAGLFAESIGDGYCQHPTHFDELTLEAIEASAKALQDEYPIVKVVKVSDGFTPLPVAAEGELGVGETQYESCKACKSFGCAVSALPGTYGLVTPSLCFDAGCNTQKVSAWRKAQRGTAAAADTDTPKAGACKTAQKKATTAAPKPTNQTPQRVIDYRTAQWRKWLARALMAQPERNQRVLVALTLAGRGGDLCSEQFGKVVNKIAGKTGDGAVGLEGHLQRADAIDSTHLGKLVQAAVTSAMFGVDASHLPLLLNYLKVDEGQHFLLDTEFLELFTMSELESLAGEIGLRSAMGASFALARAKKKGEFVAALLSVKGFVYSGIVPKVMLYERSKKPISASVAGTKQGTPSPMAEPELVEP